MPQLWNRLIRIVRSVKFWESKNNVVGVAHAAKQTQMAQDALRRKQEMEELKRLVAEGRLHEATAMQLEILRLMKELNPADKPAEQAPVDEEKIAQMVAAKLADIFGTTSPAPDPARPEMRHVHVDLTDTPENKVKISTDNIGEEREGAEAPDATDKLERLRQLKARGLKK